MYMNLLHYLCGEKRQELMEAQNNKGVYVN